MPPLLHQDHDVICASSSLRIGLALLAETSEETLSTASTFDFQVPCFRHGFIFAFQSLALRSLRHIGWTIGPMSWAARHGSLIKAPPLDIAWRPDPCAVPRPTGHLEMLPCR